MEMNEILNGLNSCGCNDNVAPQCPPQGIPNNFGGGCGGFGGGFGGFGSWIWILLILFYSGGFGGGRRNNNNNCCCCKKESKKECCCNNNSGTSGFGNCGPYLFLLVILFLCNGCSGIGNFGNCGNGSLFGGCC